MPHKGARRVARRPLLRVKEFGGIVTVVCCVGNAFLDRHFDAIVGQYKVLIQPFSGDAQKIGKKEGSYTLAFNAFETELLRQQAA